MAGMAKSHVLSGILSLLPIHAFRSVQFSGDLVHSIEAALSLEAPRLNLMKFESFTAGNSCGDFLCRSAKQSVRQSVSCC